MRASAAVTHTAVIFSTGSPGQCGLLRVHLLERHYNHLVTPFPQDTHMTGYVYQQLMSLGAERLVVSVTVYNEALVMHYKSSWR